jgi:hypothetical protein
MFSSIKKLSSSRSKSDSPETIKCEILNFTGSIIVQNDGSTLESITNTFVNYDEISLGENNKFSAVKYIFNNYKSFPDKKYDKPNTIAIFKKDVALQIQDNNHFDLKDWQNLYGYYNEITNKLVILS